MSLDVYLVDLAPCRVFSSNITHNLILMAAEVYDKNSPSYHTLYQVLWYPGDLNIAKAKELIPHLESRLSLLKANPEHFQKFNPDNGWGTYEELVSFTEKYLAACKEHPEADIRISR